MQDYIDELLEDAALEYGADMDDSLSEDSDFDPFDSYAEHKLCY